MQKRRPRMLAGLFSAVLAAAAAVAIGGPAAQAADPVRIMPLGDSITEGFNVPGGYRITLKPQLDAGGYATDFVGTFSNGPASLTDREHQGLIGWRIDQIDASVVTWLQQTTPDTVLLHAGTNDMIQGIDVANAPARLGSLIDKITATRPDAQVLVASIVPLGTASQEANVKVFNAAIPGLVQTRAAAGKHVHFVDMHAALTTADLADGIHPSETGYAKMAKVWYDALRAVPGALGGSTPSPTATSSPTATATASPTPTATSVPGGACTATFRLAGEWNGGFQATVEVVNGSRAVSSWSVAWTASGYTVAQSWGASVTTSGSTLTAGNVSYNGSLAAGGTTEFGFLGSGALTGTPTLTCTAA